jgi:3-phenylpropionate/cinnamic acid dioxygenase small subunit
LSTDQLHEVALFLLREARLLDMQQYDDWLALWAVDGRYWVPGEDAEDPWGKVPIVYDDHRALSARIARLNSGKVHAQTPPSKTARSVTNIETTGDEETLKVHSVLQLCESRKGQQRMWCGRVDHQLIRAESGLRITAKKVTLVNRADKLPPMTFLV